jgi:hypothetical protein
MTDDDGFKRLSSKELHDLAVSYAKRHLDARFFWGGRYALVDHDGHTHLA